MAFRDSFLMRSVPLPVCLALLSALPSVTAQSVGGPSASYVFHASSHSLRRIIGIPGSSYLGEARVSDLDSASVSPAQTAALLNQGGNSRWIGRLQDPDSLPLPVEGLINRIDRVLWSEDSTRAVVLSSATRQLQWVGSLDTTPIAQPFLSLESLPGTLELLATDSNAGFAYIASREEGSGRLYRAAAGEPLRLVASLQEPVSAAYDTRRQALYVLDRATRQLHEIREQGGDFADLLLSLLPENCQPKAIAIDPATSDLYVVDQASRSLLIYSLESGTTSGQLSLQALPQTLDRFGLDSFLFSPTGASPEPLFVLRTGRNAEVVFIPTGDLN